jgi:4-amino-4-deoxychorismate lyase
LALNPFQISFDQSGTEIPIRGKDRKRGAYTSVRVEGCSPPIPYFFPLHLERITRSLELLGLKPRLGISEVEKLFLSVLNRDQQQFCHKVQITLNSEWLLIEGLPIKEKIGGLRGLLFEFERKIPRAKGFQNPGLYSAVGKLDRNQEELLLISKEGLILEGSTSNLLFISANQIIIPVQNNLPGITLQVLLPELRKVFEVFQRDVHLQELPNFDEILAIGSGKEVVPILSVDQESWEMKESIMLPGVTKIYQSLKNAYKDNFLQSSPHPGSGS